MLYIAVQAVESCLMRRPIHQFGIGKLRANRSEAMPTFITLLYRGLRQLRAYCLNASLIFVADYDSGS